MLLYTATLLLLAAAPAVMLLRSLPAPLKAVLYPLPAAASTVCVFLAGLPLLDGQRVLASVSWFPSLKVDLALYLDGWGWLMALLITGIGTLIQLYAGGYLFTSKQRETTQGLLYLFSGAMLGITLADNLILLFVFWELTSISSYLLIGYYHEKEQSRNNALQALITTGAGGIALLAGLVLLGQAAGTWSMSELLAKGSLGDHPDLLAIQILVLLGALTKSAQIPFHAWLPNAMVAPTPVSAFLHSATMVKAGVFLIGRLNPVLGGEGIWNPVLITLGGLTLISGITVGWLQTDLKKILAYTTLAVLGLLTLLLGIGTELAVKSAVLFLLGHALYKAALFMVAGSVDIQTGTRERAHLFGLAGVMPLTATAGMLAAFSKSGFPPFFGFLGKEFIYKSGSQLDPYSTPFLIIALIGNLFLLGLALRVGLMPFIKAGRTASESPPETKTLPGLQAFGLWFPPLFLGICGLILGLASTWLASPVVKLAAETIHADSVKIDLRLWQGLGLPLLLSACTVAGGFALLATGRKLEPLLRRLLPPVSGQQLYEGCLQGVLALAGASTRFLQSGLLRRYILWITLTTVFLIFYKLWNWGQLPPLLEQTPVSPVLAALLVLQCACIVVAATTQSRLTALLALGFIGYGIALIFAVYSGPDLAITQILVETLIVLCFVLVVYKLPGFQTVSTYRSRGRDALVSIGFGAFMTVLVMKSLYLQLQPTISDTLSAWSYPEAKGKNVVNVILVDFRALDTLGEITVLAIAAIGVWMLLRTIKPDPKKKPGEVEP